MEKGEKKCVCAKEIGRRKGEVMVRQKKAVFLVYAPLLFLTFLQEVTWTF